MHQCMVIITLVRQKMFGDLRLCNQAGLIQCAHQRKRQSFPIVIRFHIQDGEALGKKTPHLEEAEQKKRENRPCKLTTSTFVMWNEICAVVLHLSRLFCVITYFTRFIKCTKKARNFRHAHNLSQMACKLENLGGVYTVPGFFLPNLQKRTKK